MSFIFQHTLFFLPQKTPASQFFSKNVNSVSLSTLWDDDSDNDGKPDKDKIQAPSISDVAKIVAALGAAAIGIVATVATAGAAAAGVAAGAAALAAGASATVAAAASAAAVASAGALSLVGAAAIGAGMTFSVNAADTVATGAYYGRPAQEIALSVAKDAAVSGVGILTAGIGSGITSTGSTIANMAIQTGVGALKGGINAGTGAVVNALNINQSGNLAFDTSDKYWKGAGASMLMGVGSGAVAGLAGSIGMKDANGALMAGFGSKDVKIDGLLNGLLRGGINVVGKYAVENGVGALAYHWDHGDLKGYTGTKFEWGNAMSTMAGEGLRGANLFKNGALNELLAYGGMKIGAFVGNSFQHAMAGEDLRTMRGIDLMGGVSASVDAGALVRAFGHDFINGGARDQDPASRFWQQGMESTWMGTTIFGMSADGSGFSGGFGNAHRGELNLAAIGAGVARAAVDGIGSMSRAIAEEQNKAKFREWAAKIEAEQKQREKNDAAREGTVAALTGTRIKRDGDPASELAVSDNMRDLIRSMANSPDSQTLSFHEEPRMWFHIGGDMGSPNQVDKDGNVIVGPTVGANALIPHQNAGLFGQVTASEPITTSDLLGAGGDMAFWGGMGVTGLQQLRPHVKYGENALSGAVKSYPFESRFNGNQYVDIVGDNTSLVKGLAKVGFGLTMFGAFADYGKAINGDMSYGRATFNTVLGGLSLFPPLTIPLLPAVVVNQFLGDRPEFSNPGTGGLPGFAVWRTSGTSIVNQSFQEIQYMKTHPDDWLFKNQWASQKK